VAWRSAGDLVRRAPTGHLEVLGRVKDQINRGGEKVAAEEVENQLMAHPGVLDAAVVARPDAYLGERSCAYVGPEPTAAELRRFVRERGIAAFRSRTGCSWWSGSRSPGSARRANGSCGPRSHGSCANPTSV
jgi:non-ribosomal peptide synthetase component E (peptide arylation enzyme)